MSKKTPSPKTDTKSQSGTSLISANTKLTLTLSKTKVTQAYQKNLEKLAKQISAAGFRQGKVPAKIAEEKIGQARIIESVLDELLPDVYRQAVKEQKKTPITHPEFRVISAELGKDWVIEAEFAELPELKIEKYPTHVQSGKKEAEKAAAEKTKELTKTKKSDTKEKMQLTDEEKKELRLQYIFRELVTQLKPRIPELLLKHETQHEFEHLVGQLKQLNITVDDYLKRRNSTMEQLSQELAVQTLSRLQLDLILGAIARQEKLTVTDGDREKYFSQIKDAGQREQLKKDTHYLSHLDTNLLKEKVVGHLLSL